MKFKTILIKNTNFSDDIISIILDYKKQLDTPYEIRNFLMGESLSLFLGDENTVSFHDFLYFSKYYMKFPKKLIFTISLIYVDISDIYFSLKYDDFFYRKKYNFKEFIKLLHYNFNYIYVYSINLDGYKMNIRLCDPKYEIIFRKKHKNIKRIKTFLHFIKNLF